MKLVLLSLLFVSSPALGAAIPSFQCAGTEPFYSVAISGVSMDFEGFGLQDRKFPVSQVRVAAGMADHTVYSYSSESTGAVATLLSSSVSSVCSDGMSDIEYAYHLVFVTKDATYYGCCNPK